MQRIIYGTSFEFVLLSKIFGMGLGCDPAYTRIVHRAVVRANQNDLGDHVRLGYRIRSICVLGVKKWFRAPELVSEDG